MDYRWKTRGYPQFFFGISIGLVKIYISCIITHRGKISSISRHRPQRGTEGRNQQFFQHFFAKSNISEVNFVKLFSLVYCFLQENYVRSWIFAAFATSQLWAQKLNQQPAAMTGGRMGKRDFVIRRNKVNTSGAQQYTIMASRGNKRMLFYGAFSHVFPISYLSLIHIWRCRRS